MWRLNLLAALPLGGCLHVECVVWALHASWCQALVDAWCMSLWASVLVFCAERWPLAHLVSRQSGQQHGYLSS